MALKAGYYGIKKNIKNRLEKVLQYIPESASVDNPIATKQDVNTSIGLLGDTVGWLRKNLCNGVATSETAQGVTWTVDDNDNNIVTVSGTPTGFKAFTISSSNVLSAGNYIIDGLANTVNVGWNDVNIYKNNVLVRSVGVKTGKGPTPFTILSTDDYDEIRVTLKRSDNGVECSGTAKIMICKTDVYSFSLAYAPYHETVADTLEGLTDSADDQKTAINAIIAAATGAADFAAFKTAMGAITPVTRSLQASAPDTREITDEPVVEKTTTKKATKKTSKVEEE